MNLVLKMRPIQAYIDFRSEIGSTAVAEYENFVCEQIQKILDEKSSISVTYYGQTVNGVSEKYRIIVYPYGNEVRYGFFRGFRGKTLTPIFHTIDIREFWCEICGIIRYSDLFIKA